MHSLKNKNILITGGTSTLGRAFVRAALTQGARIFFTYHQNTDEANRLEKEGAKGFKLDLSSPNAIDQFVKDFKSVVGERQRLSRDDSSVVSEPSMGRPMLDCLIHNAAAVRDHTIGNLSEEDWDLVLNVDLKAPYYLTKKMLPMMLKNRGAKILFITSRVALGGGFGVSNYAAAKAGLIGLTKSLAQELGKREILVNAVNPGFMKSSMTEPLPEAVIQKNLEANPTGRWSDPEEVAQFLAYLCSSKTTQVTGQVLHFEGRKT